MASEPTLSSHVRSWRTAFLTLRDETQTLSSPSLRSASVLHLLNHVILSQSDTLIEAAPNLPPQEVTLDILLLMELALGVFDSEGLDPMIQVFIRLSRFIQSVFLRVSLVMNSTSWALSLEFFRRVVHAFFGKIDRNGNMTGDSDVAQATQQCLETVRSLVGVYHRTMLLSENSELLDFLQGVILSAQLVSQSSSFSSLKVSESFPIFEVKKLALAIISDVYSRVGTSLPIDIWQSTIEVLRQVLDSFASVGLIAEGRMMPRFYYSVLHCLHLVTKDPKGSLAAHVSGFIVPLKKFLHYGLTSKTHFMLLETSHSKKSGKSDGGLYKPPHLRKEKKLRPKVEESSSWESDSSGSHTSSISDYSSDSDGMGRDTTSSPCDKPRVAAIVCIQDLCRAEPKLLTTQLTALLPCIDVLQPRKHEANLLSCLLFDPYPKARLAAAATIAIILDKNASVFLQIAELKDPSKSSSFTSLSSSLGQILVQLHSGLLYLVKRESEKSLLASLFKVLMSLISCTPYSRMPAELLPGVVSSVLERIEESFSLQYDDTSLLATALSCLTVALSILPPSVHILHMLMEEVNAGFSVVKRRSGILSTFFQYSDSVINPSISFEAFQALRAVAHTYPSIMFASSKQVSSIVYRVFSLSPDAQAKFLRNNVKETGVSVWEKVITAAIKVLDECLRAVSGFRGTEDLSDEKFLAGPFTSDYVKDKMVSSAPFHLVEGPPTSKYEVELCSVGCELWSEALIKHMPLVLHHSSAMVRAASVTCFAGLTSPVFCSLQKDEQGLVLTASLEAALSDDAPSVRSAACRAIGIISCFPHVIQRSEIIDKFVYAVLHNTRDPLVSVRIAASWALANICDSVRHNVDALAFDSGSNASSQLISVLIDIALKLSTDNDKVKANAVRALGNLSRFVPFDSKSPPLRCSMEDLHKDDKFAMFSNVHLPSRAKPSDWLEKMVQAFIYCVNTGNVKVQWNVCHAFSYLLVNESLKLQDMDWSSSVFSTLIVLIRDSVNFKIKIQAAAALAVPSKVTDYGTSFYDVLEVIVQQQESLRSDQISMPSNFKYKVALEKQITSTMLHMIGLASTAEHQAIQRFLAEKSPFLEEWLESVCVSLGEENNQLKTEDMYMNEKKELVVRALESLIKVFEDSHHHSTSAWCHKLLNSMK